MTSRSEIPSTSVIDEANERLREERVLSDRLIQSSLDGIVAVDRAFRYTIFNPAMERMTGVSKEEVLWKVIFEAFPFLDGSPAEAAWRSAVERHHPSSVHDVRFVSPNGDREGYYEASYAPLYNRPGPICF